MSLGGGDTTTGALTWDTSLTRGAPSSVPDRRRRQWRRMTVICLLYAGLLVAWQALRFTPVAGWWVFELLDIFGLALFVPLPALLLATLLLGNRHAGLWLLAPVALLAWEYGPLLAPVTILWPGAVRAPSEGQPVRVMTANLLWVNEQRASVTSRLTVERPDVVVLQELAPGMADYLSHELREQYPFQLLEPRNDASGLGILSRYPFRTEVGGDGVLPRACYCQRVVVDVAGRTATVLNLHPWPPRIGLARAGRVPVPTGFDPSHTTQAIRTALDDARAHAGSLLVLGDLNTSERQPLYRQLARELRDTHRQAGQGLGYTFPAVGLFGLPPLPILRIDYVFHDPSVTTWSSRSGVTPGSDHQYVVADLLLP